MFLNHTECEYLFKLNFQVVEHGLGHLPFTEKQVVTPTGVLVARPEHSYDVLSFYFVVLIHPLAHGYLYMLVFLSIC